MTLVFLLRVILVVIYSTEARQTLRNVCESHAETVVRRFGRAALFRETELGAFLALRLREKHGCDVQLERTRPFNEFELVPEAVRDAACAYESRSAVSTPYSMFQRGREYPCPERLRDTPLTDDGH